MVLMQSSFVNAQDSNDSVLGYWEASLTVPTGSLRIWMTCSQDENTGQLKVKLDSPDQGAFDLPVGSASLEGNHLVVQCPKMLANFDGHLTDSMNIQGTWTQNFKEFPLNFTRKFEPLTFVRPQMPQEPFPYQIDTVEFTSGPKKIKLAGTLTRPNSSELVPVVILISGSGPQDRDCSLMGHKPFWVIADFLTRNGVAVLRFDDRGTGKSGGKFNSATSFDFAEDVSAAVDFLKSYPGITPTMIGLAGHSEGGLIAPIVASKRDDLAFVILLAGPASTGRDILIQQSEAIMKLAGSTKKEINHALEINDLVYSVALTDMSYQDAEKKIDNLLKRKYWYRSSSFKRNNRLNESGRKMIAAQVLDDWFRTFLSTDPAPYLSKLQIPVLAVFGSKDCQVLPDPNAARMEKYLTVNGNKHVTVKTMDGLNHLMQHSTTGAISEYAMIEETFSPEVLNLMLNFVQKSCRIRN